MYHHSARHLSYPALLYCPIIPIDYSARLLYWNILPDYSARLFYWNILPDCSARLLHQLFCHRKPLIRCHFAIPTEHVVPFLPLDETNTGIYHDFYLIRAIADLIVRSFHILFILFRQFIVWRNKLIGNLIIIYFCTIYAVYYLYA